ETRVLETHVLETHVLETHVLETHVLETHVLETHVLETHVLEPSASEHGAHRSTLAALRALVGKCTRQPRRFACCSSSFRGTAADVGGWGNAALPAARRTPARHCAVYGPDELRGMAHHGNVLTLWPTRARGCTG